MHSCSPFSTSFEIARTNLVELKISRPQSNITTEVNRALNPSAEKVVALDELEEELLELVARIKDELNINVATSKTPIELNRREIAQRFEKAFPADKYLVVSYDKTTATQQLEILNSQMLAGLGDLIKLLREIRDIIYQDLLESGTVDFLQASQQLSREGTELTFTYGVCRMNSDRALLIPTMRPSQDLANRIQIINICVNTRTYSTYGPTPELDILDLFTGSAIPRKYCRVVFENWLVSSPMYNREVLSIIAQYTGFETVVVNVWNENEDRIQKCVEDWDFDDYSMRAVSQTKISAVDTIERKLEGTLGQSFDGPVKNDLMFLPQRHINASKEGESGNESEDGEEE